MQSRQLPFSGSESIVKRFRQGFSLDEHRVKFKPNPWHIPIPDPTEAKQHPEGYVAERSFDEYSKRATDVKEVVSAVSAFSWKRTFRNSHVLAPGIPFALVVCWMSYWYFSLTPCSPSVALYTHVEWVFPVFP